MTILLMLGVVIAIMMGFWSAHRRRQLMTWDRELEAAFASENRLELSRARAL